MAIPMLKIRRPLGRLIFNMGIATPGKTVFLIETAPRYPCIYNEITCIWGYPEHRVSTPRYDINDFINICGVVVVLWLHMVRRNVSVFLDENDVGIH